MKALSSNSKSSCKICPPAAVDPKRDRAGSGYAASLQARLASEGAIVQASLANPAAAAKPIRWALLAKIITIRRVMRLNDHARKISSKI